MKYYMIIERNELHIIPVTTDWDESFRILYDGFILFSGDNIPEVLRVFDEMPVITRDGF